MRSLRVITWNVLHRVHAVNWREAPVTAFPVEEARIAGITERVLSWLEEGIALVGLQEVSGDQLANLRDGLGERATVFAHAYPRLPKLRSDGPPELGDPTEHLVAIVGGGGARFCTGRTFDTDPGKGFIALDLDGVTVVVTHVSGHDRGAAQLLELARFAPERAVVMGDFNAAREAVAAAFEEPARLRGDSARPSISEVGAARPTRIGAGGEGKTIDHVVAIGGEIAAAEVLDAELLSDHNPVSALVRFP